MAANSHARTERAVSAPASVPLVESFAGNGDLSINLNRSQWMNVVGALSIAAGQLAIQRDYEQMFSYTGVCTFIGQRLGVTQQITGVADSSPPQARVASA